MSISAVVFSVFGVLVMSLAIIIPLAVSASTSSSRKSSLKNAPNPFSSTDNPSDVLTDCSLISVPCNTDSDCKESCSDQFRCDADTKKCRPPKPNLDCHPEAGCYWVWVGAAGFSRASSTPGGPGDRNLPRASIPGRWQRRCRFSSYYGDLGKGCAPLDNDGYPIPNAGICEGGKFVRTNFEEAPDESHCHCVTGDTKFLRKDGTPFCVPTNSLPGDDSEWYGSIPTRHT